MSFEVWLFLGVGLLMAVLGVPLWRRRVRPNPLYGVRVPATFKDEWVWYEANARSGRELFLMGLVIAIATAALAAFPGPMTDPQILGLAAFMAVLALAVCIRGWRRANALLAERQRRSAAEPRHSARR